MQSTRVMAAELLREKIELAKTTLKFVEIVESGSGEGFEPEYNKSRHPFHNEDGTPLLGIRVYKEPITYEELNVGKGSIVALTEIYLTDRGDLVRFCTFEETFYSSKNEKPRIQMKSFISGDQLIADDELHFILFHTTWLISHHYVIQGNHEKAAIAIEENRRIYDIVYEWLERTVRDKKD
ncbi:hypothetical protein [Evansella cellulosilytica]|uniref:Uncharacterized protein n=1 Tax=Evansella cellulosilytica (strain ATCC 21833 / DSM 2522 / FERM P-1141 / JCM 9156 / N-4) TaxID=649639 RepID=E6TU37_EVAC2|nr:hypothetical protein [Evansella cellulosilytica]ADU28497.1 hypothetical protein Bcell_0209 [Evansella cellulosilytica DSM 2522]